MAEPGSVGCGRPGERARTDENDTRVIRGYDVPVAYAVQTPVFEGPFDLLLHLILREQVDLYAPPSTSHPTRSVTSDVASPLGAAGGDCPPYVREE